MEKKYESNRYPVGSCRRSGGAAVFVCGFIFNQLVWRKTVSIPRWITDRIAGNAMPDAYEKKNNAAVAAFSQLPIRSVELHTPDGARLAAKVLTPEKPNGRLLIACHGARSSKHTGEFALMALSV